VPRNKAVLIGGVSIVVVVAVAALALFQPWKLFVDETVDEAAPVPAAGATGATSVPASGTATLVPGNRLLHQTRTWKSYEHETAGTVQVHQLADGRRVLRLEDFTTSNGPDVKVWLSKREYGSGDFATGYLNLGTLKGNRGSSNYEIPAGTDLGRFKSVVIWCKRFSVPFAAAPLTAG
jgi:hypothetical protein